LTNDQFLQSLRTLRLTRASGRTAEALGLSVRQLQRLVAGKSPVSATLAFLVIAYLKFGVPEPLWNSDLSQTDLLQQHSDHRTAIEAARRVR
jgi:plasmid maintenance system antidote protein VapI